MATIKISDLRTTHPISIDREEFNGAVEDAITRAFDARQAASVRGGLNLTSTMKLTPEILQKYTTSGFAPR